MKTNLYLPSSSRW